MSNIIFKNKGKSISILEIRKFEARHSISLPNDYVHFLLENNGGTPEKVYFLEKDADLVVNFFLSLGSQKYSLEEYFEDVKKYEEDFPDGLIPIGEDAFGNLICLSISVDNNGRIFVYDHESGKVKFIAQSITFLLNHLRRDI